MIFWVLFAAMAGIMEAGIFSHGGGVTPWPFNIHVFLTLPRIVVFVAFVLFYAKGEISFWRVVLYILSFILVFPFVHDGCYYQARHFIDYPPYHFFSQSTETNAVLSFNAINRTLAFIGGIACFYYVNKNR